MHNPGAGLEDAPLGRRQLGVLVSAFCCQCLGRRRVERNEVGVLGVGQGNLGRGLRVL